MKLQRIWLPLFWMGLIFLASSQPSDALPTFTWDLLVKKGGHFIGYALLAFSWRWALADAPYARWKSLLWTVLYAASDEWHQAFVPGRHPAFADVFIDSLGAVFALWVLPLVRRRA